MLRISALVSTAFFLGLSVISSAAAQQAPPLFAPDARYKADALLIVAHPDDDVVIGGYLARLAIDGTLTVNVLVGKSGGLPQ
jgi:hypothetical protein